MTLGTMFFTFGLIAVSVGIACFIAMVSFIQQRGVKINWFLIKLYMPRYVGKYREITIRETGRPGVLFYEFVISMNLALVMVILGAALR
ncbi:MAG: hypothetical protein KAH56_12990 [Candidatus Krumholzibacteria bacterium]|nr:hypothetical protein [Candidatus Krumholzibacteria bacterium]